MFLHSVLTTIPRPDTYPTKIADLGFRVGTKVTITHLDSRTCDGITLDMHEDAIVVDSLFEYAVGESWGAGDKPIRDRTLGIALKVYYRGNIIFWGPLHAPVFDYVTGKVQLAAHDPTLRLKHGYLRTGDIAISKGMTVDGEGMLGLLDAGQNTDAQDALNWPSLGIVRGVDTTTASAAKVKNERGDEIWGAIKDMADLYVGPDFEVVPTETDPAELASGSEDDTPNIAIPDNTFTDFTQSVSLPGDIGDFRLGLWIQHANPHQVNIDLRHPDGTNIRVYTGSVDGATISGTNFLGTSAATADLAFFRKGESIYEDENGDPRVYPYTGTYRPDAPLSNLYGKPAAGTWTLRITDTAAGSTGTLKYWRLQFLLPQPAYARMNVSDKPTTDTTPSYSCTFNAGHGQANAKEFTVSPEGDLVRTQFIATSKSGTAIRVNDAAREDYGTYQGYENPGENWSLAALTQYADNQVGAYNRPLPNLKIAPIDDGGDNFTLRYGEDFEVGGHVRAVGKVGRSFHDLIARIVEVTLTQEKSAVTCDMEVIPTVGLSTELDSSA